SSCFQDTRAGAPLPPVRAVGGGRCQCVSRASRARQKGDVLPAEPIEHVRVRRAVEPPLSGPRCAAPTSTAPHGNGAAVNALRLRALRPSGTLGLASEISA